jgi:thymidylate synthase (FAD)
MAQITRHRHLTFDVQSQRYVSFDDKEAITPVSMEADEHFSRNDGLVDLDDETKEQVRALYEEQTEAAFDSYKELVEAGVPKEDARFLLPSGTPVNITMSGNARAMLHVLNLRQTAAAQWEVRDVADAMSDYLSKWLPYTAAWWEDNGPLKKSP